MACTHQGTTVYRKFDKYTTSLLNEKITKIMSFAGEQMKLNIIMLKEVG